LGFSRAGPWQSSIRHAQSIESAKLMQVRVSLRGRRASEPVLSQGPASLERMKKGKKTVMALQQ